MNKILLLMFIRRKSKCNWQKTKIIYKGEYFTTIDHNMRHTNVRKQIDRYKYGHINLYKHKKEVKTQLIKSWKQETNLIGERYVLVVNWLLKWLYKCNLMTIDADDNVTMTIILYVHSHHQLIRKPNCSNRQPTPASNKNNNDSLNINQECCL